MDRPLLALLLFLHFVSLLSGAASTFTPSTTYYLVCGASQSTSVPDESPPRSFVPDATFLSSPSNSLTLSNPSNDSSLYANARLFTAQATYKFSVNTSGTHVLRLHFSPFSANGRDLSAARFSVYVLQGRFVLLDGFSAAADANPIHEYFLWVDSNTGLDVHFNPSSNSNSSFAFVSALELFTAPAELINSTLNPEINTETDVLQTVYRINAGGDKITPANDSLWRTWNPDVQYLLHVQSSLKNSTNAQVDYRADKGLTEEIAPDSVYNTARVMNITSTMRATGQFNFNVTWSFSVISGYSYVLRLHFCDIISKTYGNTITFNVYIVGVTGISDLSLRSRDKTDNIMEPFYISHEIGASSTGYINISIGTSQSLQTSSADANAYLNGLEIFRKNNSAGSLNGTSNNFITGGGGKSVPVGVVVGAAVGGLVVIALVIVGVFRLRKRRRTGPAPVKPKEETAAFWSPYRTATNSIARSSKPPGGTPAISSSPRLNNSFGLQIPLLDIKVATNDFDEGHIIGSGGFGKVYKGVLSDGTKVAVKRGSMESKQGFPEFENEIILLSKIRHKHLVTLIGYSEEQLERILVYEYMENGALRDYLYGSSGKQPLSWKQRLQICIGAARGLHYLHTGYSETIIHRDVKSTNILLDGDFLAKVADFGLSRVGPSAGETHVSTNIKGTFGYLDPEYFKTGKLNDKSDVYSFGVMLFEVLCARPVVMPDAPREEMNLAEWVLLWQRKGQVDKIIDKRLAGNINLNSLRKFAETAERCLADYGVDRPTFGDVLWNLEYALELHETEVRREPFEDSGNVDWQMPALDAARLPSAVLPVEGERDTTSTTTTDDSQQYVANSGIVFSQLIGGEGR